MVELIERIVDYREGHCVVQMDAVLAEGGSPTLYKSRIDTCNQIIAALRRTAEYDKAREEGRLVVLPIPEGTVFYRNTRDGNIQRCEFTVHWLDDYRRGMKMYRSSQEAEAALRGVDGG